MHLIVSSIYSHYYLIIAEIYYRLAIYNLSFLVGSFYTGSKFLRISVEAETALFNYTNFYLSVLFYNVIGFSWP